MIGNSWLFEPIRTKISEYEERSQGQVRDGTKKVGDRKRGRPRSFDETEALERITDLILASRLLRDVAGRDFSDLGVRRPSLYATFGDKESMYLKSLDAFVARIRLALAEPKKRDGTLEQTLTGIFDALLSIYESTGDDAPSARGCLLICTAASEAGERPAVRGALNALLEGIDRHFAALLEAARQRGELPDDVDVEGRAAVLAATAHSLALRARAGSTHAALKRIARTAIALTVVP